MNLIEILALIDPKTRSDLKAAIVAVFPAVGNDDPVHNANSGSPRNHPRRVHPAHWRTPSTGVPLLGLPAGLALGRSLPGLK